MDYLLLSKELWYVEETAFCKCKNNITSKHEKGNSAVYQWISTRGEERKYTNVLNSKGNLNFSVFFHRDAKV